MAAVRWTLGAVAQLEEICDYIAQDRPEQARSFAGAVLELVESIGDLPLAGRIVPEYERRAIHERILGKYRVIYWVLDDESVEIVRIVHGARKLPPLA